MLAHLVKLQIDCRVPLRMLPVWAALHIRPYTCDH
jgi:hypothetical protein